MKITKQISKQKKGAAAGTGTAGEMTESEIIVKPADSSTLEFVAQSEVLEEKIVETERAAEELQDELKRLDQAWSAPETAAEVASEPAGGEAVAEAPAPVEEEKAKERHHQCDFAGPSVSAHCTGCKELSAIPTSKFVLSSRQKSG